MTTPLFKSGVFATIGLLVTIAVSGCHFFENPDDIQDCPVGSGYPCACHSYDNEGYCDDGSICIYFNNAEKGYCSRQCSDAATCEDGLAYGSAGVCQAVLNSENIPDQCVVACDYNGEVGACPAGLQCISYQDNTYQYRACLPWEIKKSSEPASCGGFCDKFLSCNLEYDTGIDLSAEACEQACIADNWQEDPCYFCWMDCDTSVSCSDFLVCIDSCGCA
jgi:hypothetical protein